MNTVLWIISFALHFTMLYLLIILFIRYRSIKQIEESHKNIQQETEEALSYFLIELKEENEKLLTQLTEKYQNDHFSLMGQKEKENQKIPPIDVSVNDQVPEHLENLLKSQEDVVEVDAKEFNELDDQEQDLRTKTFNLLKEGYTAKEIAQKLNIGKTEVELFIKFNENQ